jgi:hypothetical protein
VPTLGPNDGSLVYAYVIVGLGGGCVHALTPGLNAALFPTAIRQSGFAFPYSVGTALVNGLTPLAMAWLVRDHGLMAPMSQCLLGGFVALILAVSVRFMPLHLGVVAPATERMLAERATGT